MDTKHKTQGGSRPGAGRKPLFADEETVLLTARVGKSQREKFNRLGGAAWLRRAITRAKEPQA